MFFLKVTKKNTQAFILSFLAASTLLKNFKKKYKSLTNAQWNILIISMWALLVQSTPNIRLVFERNYTTSC